MEAQTSKIVTVVKKAIDDKVWEQGQMTASKFQEILGDHMKAHQKEIAELREEVRALNRRSPNTTTSPNTQETIFRAEGVCTFIHSGGFFLRTARFRIPIKRRSSCWIEILVQWT